jgi:branched-chain amino acid transport system ATP-binding protein
MNALLESAGLTVAYGGLRANDRVDLAVPKGKLVGLIGPNGAGKTTFIDAITGFTKQTEGSVHFAGEDITNLSTHDRARRGLSRTWQSLELFEDITVRDNLLVAASRPKWWSFLADFVHPNRFGGLDEQVDWALMQVGLTDFAPNYPGELPHGHRKLIGVARALVAKPKLVLLDEPAAGLDSAESHELGRQLRGLLDVGITVFLIDHDMGLVLSICDHLYVLDFGRIIAEGTPAQIRANPDVVAAYLGESAGDAAEHGLDPIAATHDVIEEAMEEHSEPGAATP